MTRQLGLIVFGLAALTADNFAHAGLKDNIIFSSCAAAMRKEYQRADKQLLLSQLNDTCNCVVKQINERKNIEQAKTTCIKTGQPISSNRDRHNL